MLDSKAWVHLSKALILGLVLLSSRTPLVGSTCALGHDGQKPKSSRRGVPAESVRAEISRSAERESDAPRLPSAVTLSASPGRSGATFTGNAPEARTTAPEYLKPYTPSRTDTFLWPPL